MKTSEKPTADIDIFQFQMIGISNLNRIFGNRSINFWHSCLGTFVEVKSYNSNTLCPDSFNSFYIN